MIFLLLNAAIVNWRIIYIRTGCHFGKPNKPDLPNLTKMRLSYGRRNLQNNINFYRSYYIVFQPNFVSELVMVGKITSTEDLYHTRIQNTDWI